MATNTANQSAQSAAKIAEETSRRFEENAERAREFNASVIENSKAGGRVVVDNYEKAAQSVFSLQRQLAGTGQVEWVKTVADTQIQFAEDVSAAWIKAARSLLK